MIATGVFAFETHNLGDEMQSFAVLGHVDRVHAFLDRDRLPDYAGPPVACVFNSWFLIGEDWRPPAPPIQAIWHGFSAGREELVQGAWLEYLKAHEPIGCRDRYSTELLRRSGVEARWTGCLTLFMGRAMTIRPRKRRGVVFFDVPREAEAHIPPEIVQRAVRLSAFPSPGILDNPLARWAATARHAEILARAELVVTRRLHVALPAISFNTPVVVIPDPAIGNARRRFAGFEELAPTVFLDNIDPGLRHIDWHKVPPAVIPADLETQYSEFCKKLKTSGLSGEISPPYSTLNDITRPHQWINNVGSIVRPGQVRLRLGVRCFSLEVRLWTDRAIALELQGFPGLAKFDFAVEILPFGDSVWQSWGKLRELVIDMRQDGCADSDCDLYRLG